MANSPRTIGRESSVGSATSLDTFGLHGQTAQLRELEELFALVSPESFVNVSSGGDLLREGENLQDSDESSSICSDQENQPPKRVTLYETGSIPYKLTLISAGPIH